MGGEGAGVLLDCVYMCRIEGEQDRDRRKTETKGEIKRQRQRNQKTKTNFFLEKTKESQEEKVSLCSVKRKLFQEKDLERERKR